MKKEINRANIHRHFKSTSKMIDEPIPQWVKDFYKNCKDNQ